MTSEIMSIFMYVVTGHISVTFTVFTYEDFYNADDILVEYIIQFITHLIKKYENKISFWKNKQFQCPRYLHQKWNFAYLRSKIYNYFTII